MDRQKILADLLRRTADAIDQGTYNPVPKFGGCQNC